MVLAAIPARNESRRFPGKLLADLGGKPILWHAWARCCEAFGSNQVIVATPSKELQELVDSWGGTTMATPQDSDNGTHLLALSLLGLGSQPILNVQADEPLVMPSLLKALAAELEDDDCELVTAVHRIQTLAELENPNVVKVARAVNGEAIYFSRSPIPFIQGVPREQWRDRHTFWGHIGLYGYKLDTLRSYCTLPASALATSESLEQLRFIDAGYRFRVVESNEPRSAVDVPEDLERIRRRLAER
jgi:3-deoxy-manno-octulosonate cytidylyltransferase (CMP-KDO synthetase)